jgi:hypothetical protein
MVAVKMRYKYSTDFVEVKSHLAQLHLSAFSAVDHEKLTPYLNNL